MADVITIVTGMTETGSVSTSVKQDLKVLPAIEIAGYDELHLQVYLLGQNSGGNGIKVTILTSMQPKVDDASWISAGQSSLCGTSTPSWVNFTISSSSTTLLRYVRYQIDLQSNTTSATFTITGLARRRSL